MTHTGITEIDSVMEHLGLRYAGLLSDVFSDSCLYLIAALSGLAYLVYKALERESFKPVVFYFFYLFATAFLIGPIKIQSHAPDFHMSEKEDPFEGSYTTARKVEVRIPRLLYYVNALGDKIARAAVSDEVERAIRAEIEADRIAGYFNEYRITDEFLKEQVQDYLSHCFKPVVTLLEKKKADATLVKRYLEHPLWIHYQGQVEAEALGSKGKYCQELTNEIDAALVKLIDDEIKPSVANAAGRFREEDWEYYRSLLVRKELVAGFSDLELARRGVERHSHETYWDSHDSIGRGNVFSAALHGVMTMYVNVKQAVSNETSSRAARYQVITQAPYFYGFSQMLTLCFFPIAALYSIFPGKWKALVYFGLGLSSIKAWPIFWNLLYVFEEQTQDTGAILALPFVYIGIPYLSYKLLHIGFSAAGQGIWALGSGMGLVSAAPVKDAAKVVSMVVTKG